MAGLKRASSHRRSLGLLATLLLAYGAATAGETPLGARLAEAGEIARFIPDRALPLLPALEAAARMASPKDRGRFLILSCDVQHRLGKHEQALAACEQALEVGRQAGDTDIVARAMLYKAYVLFSLNGVDSSHQLVWDAEKLAATTQDLDLRVRLMVSSGESFAEEGNFPMALTKLQSAATLTRQNGNPTLTVISLDALAYLYMRMREPAKAFETLDEAMRVARQLNSPARMANLKTKEAILAMDSAQFERALKALLSAVELERRMGTGPMPMLANSLVNLSDCYLKLHDYHSALSYGQQALHQAVQLNDKNVRATALENIGQAYLGMGRLAEGKKNYEEGIAWDEKSGDKPNLQSVLAEYGQALERAGDLAGALRAYHRERALSNELFEKRRQKAVMELQEKYEADKRQRQIALLRQENQLKSTELDNRSLQQRIWWLLALVFALASVIVGILYRKVRQANAQLEEKNHALEQQSARDPLTALYNRRHFQEFMRDRPQAPLLAGGASSQGSGSGDEMIGALYLLDVDHFKHINDTYGHAAGDTVLREIADALRDILRETDMIVRWGGEEFLAFLPAVRRGSLDEVAQRLLDGIPARAIAYQGIKLTVNVSIGFAPFPLAPGGKPMSWERAVNLVDMALYLAKGHGRNRAYGVRSFARDITLSIDEIEQDIEKAWRDGSVELSVVHGKWQELRAAS